MLQLKTELRKRSKDYLKNKKKETDYVQGEVGEATIDYVFSDVMSKVKYQNVI